MNELQTFVYQGLPCRTVQKDGETWFVLKDVCQVLGIVKYRDVAERLDPDEREPVRVDTLGGKQEMVCVNESGLYSVILRSDKPEAKPFRKWVTSEVLPSIRKHGAYMTPQVIEDALSDPDTIIQLATTLKEERARRKELEAQAEVDRPKVLFHDAVAASDDTILIRDMAKILRQNGVPNMGGTRFYEWLRNNGYLCRDPKSSSYNLPTQRATEMGLFKVRESSRICNGEIKTDQTSRITGKGQTYFLKKFLAERSDGCSTASS